MSCLIMISSCLRFSSLCLNFLTPPFLSVMWASRIWLLTSYNTFRNLSSSFSPLAAVCFFSLSSPLSSLCLYSLSPLNSPPPHCHPYILQLLLPLSIIRCPPARQGWIPGTWVGTPWWCLLGQAAAPGATVWVVQPSQYAASFQRPRFHRLWHQVHRAGEPWRLLEWLPEWSSSGGPEGSLHHWFPEDGSRLGGRPLADQCGPGWLRGGPNGA